MEKKFCKLYCACKEEGKTHSFNDGCGCQKHNGEEFEPPIFTTKDDSQKVDEALKETIGILLI